MGKTGPVRFSQIDVFSSEPLRGNPVAVVHDADGVSDDQMAAFARWTNLSETTFLLRPTSAGADYRLRIWTPDGELPFAGHPTLGSAHAWLEAGGAPAGDDVVQECGAGLVRLRRTTEGRLAFAAPPLLRSGPVDESDLARIVTALRIDRSQIVDSAWIDNGPGWVGVLLADAATVLALDPDFAAFDDLKIGVVGPYAEGPLAIELRAFCPGHGPAEDPVTGSLNAGVAQWLAGERLPGAYMASQGTVLQRAGRVHVRQEGQQVWVGGDTRTTVSGSVNL
jgi:PhzF family phenazine biosynthesis protein